MLKKNLLVGVMFLIIFSIVTSAYTNSISDITQYGSSYTLEVIVDYTTIEELVNYNVLLKLHFEEFGFFIYGISYINLYAKIEGGTYLVIQQDSAGSINEAPDSVSSSFSFNLTSIAVEESIIYGKAKFFEEGGELYHTTDTGWFNAHTITLKTNYIGYISMVVAIGLLVIIKRLKKQR